MKFPVAITVTESMTDVVALKLAKTLCKIEIGVFGLKL